jgi:uncharacterized protein with GYD domain
MLYLQIAKHTAESCPMHNEKVKKVFVDSYNKMGQLAKKYGIKIVGSWAYMPEHFMVAVIDSPSLEALMKFSMEPENMAFAGYNTIETRPVMTLEEAMKLLK